MVCLNRDNAITILSVVGAKRGSIPWGSDRDGSQRAGSKRDNTYSGLNAGIQNMFVGMKGNQHQLLFLNRTQRFQTRSLRWYFTIIKEMHIHGRFNRLDLFSEKQNYFRMQQSLVKLCAILLITMCILQIKVYKLLV